MRGYSLIEIVLATAILAALIVPVSMLFSSSNQQFDSQRSRLYAHQIAKLALERVAMAASSGVTPVGHDYMPVLKKGGVQPSPWLASFDASNAGIDAGDWKGLAQLLSDFELLMEIRSVSGNSGLIEAVARVRFKTVTMQELVIELRSLMAFRQS